MKCLPDGKDVDRLREMEGALLVKGWPAMATPPPAPTAAP